MSRTAAQARAAVTAALAVLALVLVVAVVAASAGPDDVLPGPGPDRAQVTTPEPSDTSTEGDQATPGDPGGGDAGLFGLLVQVLVVGAGLLLLVVFGALVVALLPRSRRRRLREETVDVDDDFVVLEQGADAVASALHRDTAAQDALLAEGSPRNGVVACWHWFEQRAEQAGLPRHPWETSAEFTLRLLDVAEADVGAVERLSALYREARFSDHELTEDDRAAARAALDELRLGMRDRLGRRP